MLGTPNMGSPCADVMDIAFGMVGKQVEAVRQLQTEYVAGFNKVHTSRKGVKFSALAGDALPTMCKSVAWNDGVVSVESALWNIKDTAKTKSLHTELTGTSDFSSFVKPHVAIGPKGNHNPDAPAGALAMELTPRERFAGSSVSMPRMYGMRFNATDLMDPQRPEQPFAKLVKLQPKESAEVELPVTAGQNLGITFMAPSVVSATLLNEKGIVAGKNLANSPEAAQWFRSIYVDKGIAAGTWKVKLENTGDREMEVVLTAWSDAVK
jgi:hypothetical protein